MTVVFCTAPADKRTVLSLLKSKELAGLRFNCTALPLLDKHLIVHLGEDTDPQIFGFEGAIQIYFTSQGL